MDSIVLRDRNGKEINYHGIDYLDVKTPDGETQGYAAYDPETLVPENLVSGVVVGDVEGALKVPQAVETTIDPDFSAGDMEVVPEYGQVFSKVGILKPANLLPENIAKDVDIAGVVGTHEGGGSNTPFEFVFTRIRLVCLYNSYGTDTETITAEIPPNAIITRVSRNSYMSGYSTSSSRRTYSFSNSGQTLEYELKKGADYNITDGASSKTITASMRLANTSSEKYGVKALLLTVAYTVPGIMQKNENGNLVLYGDSSVTKWYGQESTGGVEYVDIVDLRETLLTSVPSHSFMGCRKLREVRLPPTITSIYYPTIESYADEPLVIDMSNFTHIPTLQYYSESPTFYAKSGLQILVPASLYDEWIARVNWTHYADNIVAV